MVAGGASQGRSKAFTFIEIMIVIVILGILIAVALPNMAGTRDATALRSAANDFANGGMTARQMAIVQGEETFLFIDAESGEWRIALFDPELEEKKRLRDQRGASQEERPRSLPERITIAKIQSEEGEMKRDEPQRITFYPNGASSGVAVEFRNRRDRSLTVEFDRTTGRPEVYDGAPKSMAAKLRERGIDPAVYGLQDDSELAATAGADPGFHQTAGANEEQRVQMYKDAAQRMLERARARHAMNEAGGPAAYYQDSQRWGGR